MARRRAIRCPEDAILEPSCGDGVFLTAARFEIQRQPASRDTRPRRLVAVELLASEADRARKAAPRHAEVITGDFFQWLAGQRAVPPFNVVLGNPPFIRCQNFPEPSRSLATRLMEREGLRPNRLTNIWVPFVVASTAMLREDGRLAMVVPAELLQVSYAAQLRRYLVDSFRRITVFACNELFFDGAEQEVVLLAAEGKMTAPDPQNRCDVALVAAESVGELLRRPLDTRQRRNKGQARPTR